MKLHAPHRTFSTGLTLIELMVVLVIVGIMAMYAWPAYQQAVQKSRRADAFAALGEIAQAQERWRANNPSYQANLALLPGVRNPPVSHDGHYDLSLVDGSVTNSSYTARATARAGSPQAADAQCQALELAMTGNNGLGNISYRSIAQGGAANAAPDPCWVR